MAVSFRPESLGVAPGSSPGQVDYRLVRKHAIDEFHRGRLGQRDICDAHPELLRAARHTGRPVDAPCPICTDPDMVQVSFVFGPRLPAHGRCVTSAREMSKLERRGDELACYVVEVCPACSWNHLVRSFPLGGRRR